MPSGNSIQTCYQLHRLGFTTQFWYQLSLVLNSVHLPLPHMQPFISCMAWYWIPWQYHSHYYQLDLVIYNLELPCTCYQQDIMLPLSPLSLSKNLASSQYQRSVVSGTAWYQQCIHIIWVVSLAERPEKQHYRCPMAAELTFIPVANQPRTKRHH